MRLSVGFGVGPVRVSQGIGGKSKGGRSKQGEDWPIWTMAFVIVALGAGPYMAIHAHSIWGKVAGVFWTLLTWSVLVACVVAAFQKWRHRDAA